MFEAQKESATARTSGALKNNQQFNTTATKQVAQARFAVYRSKYDTLSAGAETIEQLAKRAANPSVGEKGKAIAYTPFNASGKRKEHAEKATYCAVVVDHDDGNFDRDDIANHYSGAAHIAYSTSSHYQDGKGERWKVVLPLAEALPFDQWQRLSQGAWVTMGGDKSQARAQQIFYAPNKVSDDAPYGYLIDLDSPRLSPDDALGEQFMANGEQAEEATARASPIKGGGGSGSHFHERVNREIDIGDALARHGYKAVGPRWRASGSQSGIPGVVLIEDGDKPVIFSWHGPDTDPLSAESHKGHALDAFDVVTVLDYGGDAKAAHDDYRRDFEQLKAASADLTEDSDSADIDAIIEEARSLSAVDKRRVHDGIKKRTKIPLKHLEKAESEMRDEGGGPPDHRDLALRVIKRIGKENTLSDDANLWRYRAGVWRTLPFREERASIQDVFAEAELEVKKSGIDGTADAIRNELYRPRHEWNIGNPEAVSCRSGLLVLDNGYWHLRPHRREDYRTAQLPIEYDPKAIAPRFEQYLCEVFKGDPDAGDKMRALLELIGYTLVTHARFEKFVILVGEGGNGKSKVLKIIQALCGGENTTAVQPQELDNRFQRASLHLKLANLVSEVKEGAVFPDAALKAITSGELATVEHKFGTPFEIAPYSTCWFGTNHMPSTRDFSEGTFRRACVFKFNNKFKEGENADTELDEKLAADAPGVLNMVLEAYGKVVERGYFTEPASCADAKREWRLDADQVARFIEECCSDGYHTQTTKLYNAYKEWSGSTGIKHTLTQKSFVDRVTRRGYEGGKYRGERGIFGLTCESAPGSYLRASQGW